MLLAHNKLHERENALTFKLMVFVNLKKKTKLKWHERRNTYILKLKAHKKFSLWHRE